MHFSVQYDFQWWLILPQIGVYTVEETEDTADANRDSNLKKYQFLKLK
jgi:hypothetical protein